MSAPLRWLRLAGRRVPAWLALAVSGSTLLAVGTAMDASAADDAVPVYLSGVGDFDVVGELVDWQNALYGADQPTDFTVTQRGSALGRDQLLEGVADFAISAAPFTEDELASRPAGSGDIIDVPLSVGALSILLTTPNNGGWATTHADQACLALEPDDPETCISRGTFTDPIRIPPENLAALIIGLSPDFQNNRLTNWNNADFAAALGTKDLNIQGRPKRHSFLNRSEAASSSKYLMTYAKALAPVAWDLRKQENPQYDWDALNEQFSSRTVTKNGAETVLGAVALSRLDAVSGGQPDTWSGNMTAVPTTYVDAYTALYPNAGFRVAEIQNRHGDWLLATPETISAALAAGTTADHAALNDVPGAYPLVYVNHLFSVAGTLGPDEANALAAAVRFIVTDGQASVVADGGAPLTADLVADALAKADQIVQANCTAEGYEVTTSGPSAFEPDTPTLQAITAMLHCTPVPAPTTTTSTSTTSTVAETTTTLVSSTTSELPTTTTIAETRTLPPTTPTLAASVTPVDTRPSATPITVRSNSSGSGSGSGSGGTQPVSVTVATNPPESESTAVDVTTTLPDTAPAEQAPQATDVPVTTTSTTAPVGGGGGTRPRGVSLRQLPMSGPDDGSHGTKQLGTVMLGAALYLLGRKLVALRRVAVP